MGDRVDLGVGTFACIWWLFMCMIECGDTEILACRVLTWLFKIAKSLEAGGGVRRARKIVYVLLVGY